MISMIQWRCTCPEGPESKPHDICRALPVEAEEDTRRLQATKEWLEKYCRFFGEEGKYPVSIRTASNALHRGLFTETDPGKQLHEYGLVAVDYSLLKKERYAEEGLTCITRRFRVVLTSDEDKPEDDIILVPIPVQYNLGSIFKWRLEAGSNDLRGSLMSPGAIPVELPGHDEDMPVELEADPVGPTAGEAEETVASGTGGKAKWKALFGKLKQRYTSND